MPRKTKEQQELEPKTEPKKAVKTTKKTVEKKESKKNAVTKKVEKEKKPTTKKTTTKTTTKKTTTKKTATKKATGKKTSTTKKVATKKQASAKKTTTKKASSTAKSKKKVEIVEYYDLPYRYNQTVVRVLAQTPTNLFVYWDISDKDRKNFENKYGENFFETTRPVLIVHNNTKGYSFEIEINDFANSWYLHVTDSKCDYKIELGRRPIFKTEKINSDYIYITTSNEIESPNDRILYDANQKMVYFRNVKNGQITGKAINTLSFIRNMGKIYNIYDLYKAIYQNENMEEFYNLNNPTSGNPSSNSFSSRFK